MRFLFLFILAGGIAAITFPFTGDFSLFVEAALWIYSLTVAFLIDKAIGRKNTLRENINIELARLRHIHHISEQLGKVFSRKIDKLLLGYEKLIEQEFLSYHESTTAFRKLSHAVYSFEPKTEKEGILYADLLHTLQDLTLGRQSILFELRSGLGFYDWFLIVVVLICLLTLLLVHVDNVTSGVRFVLTLLAVLVSLIPVEMLWKSDHYSQRVINKLQAAYGTNIQK